jgi:hypothetical protein
MICLHPLTLVGLLVVVGCVVFACYTLELR